MEEKTWQVTVAENRISHMHSFQTTTPQPKQKFHIPPKKNTTPSPPKKNNPKPTNKHTDKHTHTSVFWVYLECLADCLGCSSLSTCLPPANKPAVQSMMKQTFCVCVRVRVHVCGRACVHACMRVCMHACVRVICELFRDYLNSLYDCALMYEVKWQL